MRQRVEKILAWAKAKGFSSGDNPATWHNHLDKILPQPTDLQKVKHHPALPYAEIGAFMEILREREAMSRLALEFCILTAVRTNEVLAATAQEFDLKKKLWTIPAGRMKADREHRVPLSDAALAVLAKAAALKQRIGGRVGKSNIIFCHDVSGGKLSNGAMLALLKRLGRDDVTVHGFRSTFRDWAEENTAFPRTSPRPHWRIPSRKTKPKKLICELTYWKSAGC